MGDPDVVATAVRGLRHSAPAVRIAATHVLAALRAEEAAAALAEALEDESGPVRRAALLELAELAPDTVASHAHAALGDPNPLVRATAVELVSERVPGARDLLPALAADDEPLVRRALGRHAGSLPAHAVGRLLHDDDPAVRAAAAASAGPEARTQLERALLTDSLPAVRRTAARRLADLGQRPAADALGAALSDTD